jgi:hypothetical protein
MSASSFNIVKAEIYLASSGKRTSVVDVAKNIIELVFFESLSKPFVDARLVLLDDFGFRNDLSIQGTERIFISISAGAGELPSINKTFFFSKINDVVKNNERSEVVSIDLVEEHVYINAMKSISRSYSETLDNMIVDIADRDLGAKIIKTSYFDNTAQGERKVIIPYLSPLEAMQWIGARMTTKTGAPIYVHGDLFSNSLYMSGLDKLMGEDVVNQKLPLRYNDAASSGNDIHEIEKTYTQIQEFKELDAEDSLALYEEGAIGSYYANIDAGTGQVFGTHITVRDILDDFYTNGLIDRNTTQSIFDPSLFIDGRPSDEFDAVHIHQITSSKTYNQFKSYHDETPQIEGDTVYESRLKIKNKVIRQIMRKNTIDIQMDGQLFLEKKISVSRKMRVLFLSANTQQNLSRPEKNIDSRKSGDYLITNTSHRMMDETHTVILRMVKLGDLPSDFSL